LPWFLVLGCSSATLLYILQQVLPLIIFHKNEEVRVACVVIFHRGAARSESSSWSGGNAKFLPWLGSNRSRSVQQAYARMLTK